MRLIAALLVLCVTACAPSGLTVLSSDELPDDIYSATSTVTVDPRVLRVLVFFVKDDRLAFVAREVTSQLTAPELAVRELLEGPSEEEIEEGFRSAVPPEARLLSLDVTTRTATLNLTGEFEAGADRGEQLLRLAQMVFTLTELPGVDSVRFQFDGEPRSVVGQDGRPRGEVAQGQYSNFSPRAEDVEVDPCTIVAGLLGCEPDAVAAD